ncbi:MAG: adenine phosphoribosyltransferase [Deltaproteobacteria bacterium]|nr:adenine phosphoribosyltransferase [Deltaproteobacteria bacterium]
MDFLRSFIRDVPDFPKPGVLFKDITPLLADKKAFRSAINEMARTVRDLKVDKVVAVESRGFIFGSALSFALEAGLVIVRKPNKLPYKTTRVEYALEYGNDSLEVHVDSFAKGEKVIIVDDVLATGGTALATAKLVESAGASVAAMSFLLELEFLHGRQKIKQYSVKSLLTV